MTDLLPNDEKKKVILIAEDEIPLAKAFSVKLENSGFKTITATSGEDVWPIVEKGGIDLIILDIMMPNINGFQILEKLRSSGSNIPVFVTSNLGQNEDIEKAKKLGAKEYFIKSNTPIKEIAQSVEKILK